jgi:hypothetical protein
MDLLGRRMIGTVIWYAGRMTRTPVMFTSTCGLLCPRVGTQPRGHRRKPNGHMTASTKRHEVVRCGFGPARNGPVRLTLCASSIALVPRSRPIASL